MHRPITVPSRTSRAANKAWCRGAYRHGCASSADPASSATGPACKRGSGSETSRRRRAPRHEPVIDVKPDHRGSIEQVRWEPTAQFGGEGRVGGELELRNPVRLQAVPGSDPLHRRDADGCSLGHGSCSPMRGLAGRPSLRQGHDAHRHLRAERRDAGWPCLVAKEPARPSRAKRSCQRQTAVLDYARLAQDPRASRAHRRSAARFEHARHASAANSGQPRGL